MRGRIIACTGIRTATSTSCNEAGEGGLTPSPASLHEPLRPVPLGGAGGLELIDIRFDEGQRLHPARYVGITHSGGGVTFAITPVSGFISNVRPIRTARHPIRIISVIGPA